MIRNLSVAALCLLSAACGDSELTGGPSAIAPLTPLTPISMSCVGSVESIQLDANLAGPQLLVSVAASSLVELEVLENGELFHRAYDVQDIAIDAHFGATYMVKARTSPTCPWAEAEKVIGPNHCGDCGPVSTPPPAPQPPAPPSGPSIAPICFDNHFTSGVVRTRAVTVPAGRYQIELVTEDPFHRPGYQPGQVEVVRLHGVGDSIDIPDAVQSQRTIFDRELPDLSSITVSGVSGSVKSACVTFLWMGR